jgi:enoyl-CoA hydratase
MADDSVIRQDRGAVAEIVLNRPEKRNALNLECLDLLHQHFTDIAVNDSVRAVYLHGAGGTFCSGGDLSGVQRFSTDLNEYSIFIDRWHEVFNVIEQCPKSVVAGVAGFALGGGFELMLTADVILAATDARLGCHHSRHGLYPGGGATQRLPRQIGSRLARWLLLSGEWITPERALDAGVVIELAEPSELDGRCWEVAELLAARSPLISANIKKALRLGDGIDQSTALLAERAIALSSMLSEDTRIGLLAYHAGTPPSFVGR